MVDIKTRYTEGSTSQYGNYIGKGLLLILTTGILIFSALPHRFCCKNSDKDDNSDSNPEDKSDDKLNILDCNCVWNNPLRIFLLSLVLIILLGTTLYLPDIVLRPTANLFQLLKYLILGIFNAVKSGIMGFFKAIKNNIPKFLKIALLFSGVIGFILTMVYLFYNFANGMLTIATSFLVIGALALIYKYVQGSVVSKFMSLVVSVVFFLPCLLRDLFTYIHKELKLATPIEWSILFVELVIIAVFFIIPKIYKYIMKNRGTILVDKAIYTNTETIIQNKKKIKKNPDIPYADPKSTSIIKKHDYNYAISLWLYIDARPPNTSYAYEKFTPLFSFQKMPEMLYRGTTNEFKIMMQKDMMNEEMYTIYKKKDLPLQKWNHFVINYDSGTLDIFLNNELVVSEKNVSPKIENEDIQIGSNNGVHGGICNVQYFDEVLTQGEISFLYKSLKHQKIPSILGNF